MRRIIFLPFAVIALAGVASYLAAAAEHADGSPAPIFGIKIFPGYRDWKLISVAHEAGNLNDIRAILGNDIAIKAYREGKQWFPDGAVVARLAWNYVPSEENNRYSPGSILRCRLPAGLVPAVHGQGLKKIRCHRGLGVRSI